MENYPRTGISFDSTKEAALYFDHVIPMGTAFELVRNLAEDESAEDYDPANVFNDFDHTFQLVPENLREVPRFKSQLMRIQGNLLLLTSDLVDLPDIHLLSANDIIEKTASAKTLRESLIRFLTEFDLGQIPVITRSGVYSPANLPGGRIEDVSISMTGMNLIDASRASWEQILEFREDPNAIHRLRRLRMFAAESYEGKSLEFVKDDLAERLYVYDEEVRRSGFETRQSVLTMILNSKVIGTGIAGALASLFFGSNEAAVGSVALGTVVELGRIGLEISRKRFLLRNALLDNPVSYIKYANEKLISE